jgi:hypothetical protein
MGKSIHVKTRERDEFSLDEKLGFGVSELGSRVGQHTDSVEVWFSTVLGGYFILKIKHLIIIF